MKRKGFKGIIRGLLGSFVSRNNDVYGYWGIGKLYSHMIATNSQILEIDLISKTIEPLDSDNQFLLMIGSYSDWMFNQMEKRGINVGYLKEAKIILERFPNKPIKSLGQIAPHRVLCKIYFCDEKNNKYEAEMNIQCREHNSELELKSGRKY